VGHALLAHIVQLLLRVQLNWHAPLDRSALLLVLLLYWLLQDFSAPLVVYLPCLVHAHRATTVQLDRHPTLKFNVRLEAFALPDRRQLPFAHLVRSVPPLV
jgi:hypothetical protein